MKWLYLITLLFVFSFAKLGAQVNPGDHSQQSYFKASTATTSWVKYDFGFDYTDQSSSVLLIGGGASSDTLFYSFYRGTDSTPPEDSTRTFILADEFIKDDQYARWLWIKSNSSVPFRLVVR